MKGTFLRREQINPLAVTRSSDAARTPSVTRKKLSVRRDVIMHRPFRALHLVANAFARSKHNTCQPKLLSFGGLQVVPDDFSVGTEELMAGNFHIHGSRVDLAQAGSVRADCPDAIHLVPRSLVAKQEKLGIGRRELHVVQPIGA